MHCEVLTACACLSAGPASASDKVGEFTASGFLFKDSVEVVTVEDSDGTRVTKCLCCFQWSQLACGPERQRPPQCPACGCTSPTSGARYLTSWPRTSFLSLPRQVACSPGIAVAPCLLWEPPVAGAREWLQRLPRRAICACCVTYAQLGEGSLARCGGSRQKQQGGGWGTGVSGHFVTPCRVLLLPKHATCFCARRHQSHAPPQGRSACPTSHASVAPRDTRSSLSARG